MKLEVVPLPVRDVDAAKDFYTSKVGFTLDHDASPGNGMRIVQMTPPGSACSVVIGEGLPLGEPGSVKGVQLVVDDLDTLRNELVGRGVGISEVQQMGPEGMPGSRFCFFDDPDGNTWAVQEYKRSLSPDVPRHRARLGSLVTARAVRRSSRCLPGRSGSGHADRPVTPARTRRGTAAPESRPNAAAEEHRLRLRSAAPCP
jgi:catechol 2,3-dioxygenase-like lactoylglutathione lyase family enzyme